jgi:hypothetical protein
MPKLPGLLLIAVVSLVLAGCALEAGGEASQEQANVSVTVSEPVATADNVQGPDRASPTPLTPATDTPMPTAQSPTATVTPQPSPTNTRRPTLTPTPTWTPAPTAVPLTEEAIEACPVSLPNLDESPDAYYISTRSGYGNEEGTMFIGLWPEGRVIFRPDGPGRIYPDGRLGMKFWFYRTVPGEVVFSGQRLDATAPPLPEVVLRGVPDGYGETGFHPAGLVFAGPGCWEVTGRVGESTLTFVTLVILTD